jgi:hypothetical protein
MSWNRCHGHARSPDRLNTFVSLTGGAAALLVASIVWAHAEQPASSPVQSPPAETKPETPPAQSPPAQSPPASEETKPASEGKTLDELLGLPGAAKAHETKPGGQEKANPAESGGSGDPALDEAKRRLERGLNEAELDSLLKQALAGMQASAMRLSEATDTSLTTQRVQEDVVAKLDQLIEEAKRRSKSGQCKSSGSSSGEKAGQAKQQANAGKKPSDSDGQKPGESKTRANGDKDKKGARNGEGNKEGESPSPVDPADEQAGLDETQAEWGALPERVRDLIRQGSRDRIASIYQRLTQEYYRRMAEDASR